MTVQEWLNRGRDIDKAINSIRREKEKALAAAVNSVAGTNGQTVQVTRRNTSEDKFIKYASYSEQLEQYEKDLIDIKSEIAAAIQKVKNPTLYTVLFQRYVEFKRWEEIALDMNYSYVHVVHNLHPKALAVISKIVTISKTVNRI